MSSWARVITVSRQVGSYGDEIASLVAQELGYRLVGKAEFLEIARSLDPEFAEAQRGGIEASGDAEGVEGHFLKSPAYTSLFESVIYRVASQGKVVILGRGAQVVLREVAGVFKARIVAPLEVRVRRVMEQKGASLEEASEFVSRYDHQRRMLVQSVYFQDLRDWFLYDLILNTASLDPKAGAAVLCAAVEAMGKEEGPSRDQLLRLSFAKRVECEIRKWLVTSVHRHIEVLASGDGEVLLTGYVQDEENRHLAERIAQRVGGVKRVENRLRITGIR